MWRLFDKGLHLFLKNHVYLPVIQKSGTLFSRLLGSFSAFFVVFLWHGPSKTTALWALANWFGLLLEGILRFLSKKEVLYSHRMIFFIFS